MTYRKKDWHGGSQKTATTHASASTKNTAPPTTTRTDESANYSQATEKKSSLGPCVRDGARADCAWPGERHYTYVRAEAVRSSNPGYCFQKAGWNKCGYTQNGLTILERTAPIEATQF